MMTNNLQAKIEESKKLAAEVERFLKGGEVKKVRHSKDGAQEKLILDFLNNNPQSTILEIELALKLHTLSCRARVAKLQKTGKVKTRFVNKVKVFELC